MKNTILSEKDLKIIEEIILSAGKVADAAQIMGIIRKKYSLSGAKKRMAQLTRAGWLIKLKKGLYQVVTDISGLKSGDMTLFNAASALNHDSYISFESALQYYGLFDQMLSGVYSVTAGRARKYKMNNSDIVFFKIKKELFFGYEEKDYNGAGINMASKEKALLDTLYYHPDYYHAGLVWDVLKEHKDVLDWIKLSGYAGRFGAHIIRQVGFFAERLGLDFSGLLEKSSVFKGYSRMTKDSGVLDKKWRLYFDPKIVK